MSEYIDTTTHEILDDADMHTRYDEWLDSLYGEITIGNSVFSPSEILKELEPITYNVGFSDFENFSSEDNSIINMDNSPVCEDCSKKLTADEVIVSLADAGYLLCEDCLDEDI